MTRLHGLLVALATTLAALAMTLTLAPSAQAAYDDTTAPATSGGVTLDTDATVALATGGTVTPITSPPPGAGSTTGVRPDVTVVNKWYGKQYRFSYRETRNIAAGGSLCTLVLGKVPAIGVLCSAASASANLALANDKCLAYNVYYGGPSNPWYWNC